MIPVLRSIDSLLNRFDELSKCHSSFLSNFDTNFSDIENPLRHVARTEEEQLQTSAKILSTAKDNNGRKGSTGTVEDFHRCIVKTRYHHRPPVYSSNDNFSLPYISSRTSSIATDSTLLPRISQITTQSTISQSITSASNLESKEKLMAKIKSKLAPQTTSVPRRSTRGTITVFTIETVNRLSKPKRYVQLPEQKPNIKYNQRRSKNPEIRPTYSVLPIKRTTNIKPCPKKFKADNRIPMSIPKSTFRGNSPSPVIVYKPVPTVCLSYSNQAQQKTSRTMVLPKGIMTNKRSKT